MGDVASTFDFPQAPAGFERRSATVDPSGTYRYDLTRRWAEGELANFVMLNPSTADDQADDNTVRRCARYARDWGFAGVVVTNLYALRSTDPRALLHAPDPIGPGNQGFVERWAEVAAVVVLAWGHHGLRDLRGARMAARLQAMGIRPTALRLTGDGQPFHPLRMPARLKPRPVVATETGVAWAQGGMP